METNDEFLVEETPKIIEAQNKRIKKYLESGKRITKMDALYMYGCFNLPGRIYDIKKMLRNEGNGVTIDKDIVVKTSPSVSHGRKRFAQYKLVK